MLACLIFLSGAAHLHAQAGWTAVAENDDIRVYANRATLLRQGDLVKMWSLFDYERAQDGKKGRYLSSQGLDEYDCAGRRSRLLIVSEHSGAMGRGKVLATDRTENEWEAVPETGLMSRLWALACRR